MAEEPFKRRRARPIRPSPDHISQGESGHFGKPTLPKRGHHPHQLPANIAAKEGSPTPTHRSLGALGPYNGHNATRDLVGMGTWGGVKSVWRGPADY